MHSSRRREDEYGRVPAGRRAGRGINGRGETVVLPELAESRVNPPLVTDMRQDMAAFDSLYRLPAARMRVDGTLAGARAPWLAFGEEVLDVEMVHALAPDATLAILLLPTDGTAGSPFQASGGGFSRLFSRPGYQDGVPGIGATRGVPTCRRTPAATLTSALSSATAAGA
jgi:subtilase family serine protease